MVKSNGKFLYASPEFIKRLKIMQGKILAKNGEKISLTKISDLIPKQPEFESVEKRILELNGCSIQKINVKWD